nr:helix-turn-helix transcriptional regulator [uncultured Blautia sp.]
MKNSKSIDRVIQVNDIDIGKNITLLRKSMHIKQTDMVARLQIMGIDISIYSYNRVEKGKQNPTVSFLFACCKILNCDMNTLFSYPISETTQTP